jgi:hypothetical protein
MNIMYDDDDDDDDNDWLSTVTTILFTRHHHAKRKESVKTDVLLSNVYFYDESSCLSFLARPENM